MVEFNLTIDIHTVFKHLNVPDTLLLKLTEYPIGVDNYKIGSEICDGDPLIFKKRFEDTLKANSKEGKHDLMLYAENMLAILLLCHRHAFELLNEYQYGLEKRKLGKEVFKLLINLNEENLESVTFKFGNGKYSNKLKRNDILDWIKEIIITSIEEKNYPMGAFGWDFLIDISPSKDILNYEKLNYKTLKETVKNREKSKSALMNQAVYQTCWNIKWFLDSETPMNSSGVYNISDEQGDLFYDLLKDVFSVDLFTKDFPYKDYTKADYVRSLLKNKFTYLNRKTKSKN